MLIFVDLVVLATPPTREGSVVHTYTRVFVFAHYKMSLLLASLTVQWFVGIMYTRIFGEAQTGEVLSCVRKRTNWSDAFAVAVKKNSVIVGHIPRNVSVVYSLFYRRNGSIQCRGTRQKRICLRVV